MVPPIPQAAWAAPSSTIVTLPSGNASNISKLTLGSDTYQLTSTGTVKYAQIIVPNGVNAVLYVPGSLTIDNAQNTRSYTASEDRGISAIDIQGNGSLVLYVQDTMKLYGSAAGNGENARPTYISNGGPGGKAAISVPSGAILTLRGNGTLYAYGGAAGDGGSAGEIGSANQAGAAGGGAGAGIGGNGGKGGHGVLDSSAPNSIGEDGGAGISAGTINVYDTVKVYAYGGTGGSGGQPVLNKGTGEIKSTSGSGGGGGYPAAGVGGGGGGAGGADHGNGGGGFSGGAGQQIYVRDAINGQGGPAQEFSGGGGYFSKGDTGSYAAGTADEMFGGAIGGGKVDTVNWQTHSGQGGNAGSGGTVKVANLAKLYAYNGSSTTTSKNNWGQNQTPIYWQNGYSLVSARSAGNVINKAGVETAAHFNADRKLTYYNEITKNNLGVGSGAGFIESHNGSFTTQKVPERVALATLCERNIEYF
ncbi:MAG: hypothetical protein HFI72_02290 [Peptococcaceae bacterium]|nr:hypothetical protein [Peptococcaceae bacterium]